MKNVVVIGGGHGLSVIVRGLKQLGNIKLSAIVTVMTAGAPADFERSIIFRQWAISEMSCVRWQKVKVCFLP